MEGFDDSHMPALMCRALDLLNRLSGDQRFTPVKALSRNTYLLPTLSLGLTQQNLKLMGQVLNKTRGTVKPDVLRDLVTHTKQLSRRYLPGGTNPSNFIAAAGARKVPMKILSNGYLAFGYGSGSVIFNSSITDQEKFVGVMLARSKVDTNAFLKLSGFPVVEQQRITTLEQALNFAENNGYPVVIKPEDEEQGRGIYANIKGEDDLKLCFESASKTYKNLIIETHAPGDHYRIDFMGDQLIKAARRRAPQAVGDGRSTIREIVDEMNRDPERLDAASSLKPIAYDEDLDRCLKNQGMSLDDVPEVGASYYLKSISNLSRGGSQVHVEDIVHPENYALCQAVARCMRVDIAGVDLISPDLAQPWYSNGAVICEVNAKPQLGRGRTEVYWQVLSRYLGPKAHVTLNVVTEDRQAEHFLYDTDNANLELTLSAQHLLQHGSPTQYFDRLTFADDVTAEERSTLEAMLQSVPPEI
ncbi:MAG: hypothetical protein AAFO98_01735 [Pseudomonadota bacterium]